MDLGFLGKEELCQIATILHSFNTQMERGFLFATPISCGEHQTSLDRTILLLKLLVEALRVFLKMGFFGLINN
jgi:hypothetical protein